MLPPKSLQPKFFIVRNLLFMLLSVPWGSTGSASHRQPNVSLQGGLFYMNILFFLKPKAELDLVYEDDTVEMAMERIEDHQFSSIPMINEKTGKYIGTLSEGDLLRTLRKGDVSSSGVLNRSVMTVHRKRDYKSVRADSDIEELFAYVTEQNFVPVVDDTGVLIGIVLRSSILEFVFKNRSAQPAFRPGAVSGR